MPDLEPGWMGEAYRKGTKRFRLNRGVFLGLGQISDSFSMNSLELLLKRLDAIRVIFEIVLPQWTKIESYSKKISRLFLSLFLIPLLSLAASAQESGVNSLQLQMVQSQYLGETQNLSQNSAYSSFGFQFKSENQKNSSHFLPQTLFWSHGLNVLGLLSADGTEQGYFAAPEFYIGLNREEIKAKQRLFFGRKKLSWSRFDDEWRLGIWQPYVRWDYLHPRSQGLTGFFGQMERTEKFQFTLFATPLFLPDQGPQFEVVDGEFRSSNRWFRQPSNQHTVVNHDRRLVYSLDRPSEEEIIMNSAFGAQIFFGQQNDGPWLNVSFANKPINQLHIGIEGYHSITRVNSYLTTFAVVHPMVVRHNLITGELGFNSEDFRGWISITEEHPNKSKVPEAWEESSLNHARFLGASFSHRINIPGLRSQWLKYSYMTMQEDLPNKDLEIQEDKLESSLDRYPFQEVMSVEWTAPLISRQQTRLDFGLRFLHSFPERGSLLSAKVEWMWGAQTRWDIGADILGVENENAPSKGLMSLYRNNDRIMGAMTYVF